jgi:hypothetical protein
MASLLVAGATLVAAPASAHTPAASIGCERTERAGAVAILDVTGTNYGQGANVTVKVDGAAFYSEDFTGDFHRTGSVGSGYVSHHVVVHFQAQDDPDGSLGYSKTFDLHAPACKQRTRIYGPMADISAACGDPMIRWELISRSLPAVFTITGVLFHGGTHTWTATLPRATTRISDYHHLLGGSRITIRSSGRVLATKLVEPAGNYGKCPR